MLVDILVEGLLDEAVARSLLRHCGHTPGVSFGKRGIDHLRTRMQGFNVRASYGNPILTLVDFMDTGYDCPPGVLSGWLPDRSPRLLLRVVVREIESWLLADRDGIAALLGISPTLIPHTPETLTDPKRELVNLARRTRRKTLRSALVPAQGISAVVGPEYVAVMGKFAAQQWDIDGAARSAPSLARAIARLTSLIE